MRFTLILLGGFIFLMGYSSKGGEKSDESEQSRSEGLAISLNNSFGITTSKSSPEYPNYYGGYYHDDGKLVILIAKGSKNYEKDLDRRIGDRDYVTKACDFSYNDLLKVRKKVADFFLNERNESIIDEITINSVGIDTRGNRIFVSLKECTPHKITLFKDKIIDSPVLRFEEWNGPIIAE